MADLGIKIHKLELKNPVMTASGTFGNGVEFDDFIDVDALGGILLKGTTLHHREGNDYPRMAETASGMLNAVGLQNKGVDYFCEHIYPLVSKYKTNVIVNVNGSTIEEYIELTQRINELEHIAAIELNISCPNVKEGGMAFGTSCPMAEQVTREVRKVYDKTLIVKLSPNVTSIVDIAKAVEAQGADSVSLVNTFLGMAIDAEKRKPMLSTVTGGLSGPAIKPIALRMVWQVAQAVKIPVIGMGGIMNAADAIEFMLAGASAVQIGTANFIEPNATIDIIKGINQYLDRHKILSASDLIGGLQL
jgi:dihydroorotate dehydrogenase (NAD+) catalytic subunit